MAELRVQIDALDTALIDLLAQRVGYIDRAVDLKKVEGLPARTVDHVAEVKAHVRALAEARNLDPDLAEALGIP
ncbi:isochorismate pyruvate lyase [Loktanella sp. DSM 29012]|uniref:chorismate mutase n=1 Tax=Loktanella sp. DSM 29012 TaxID=1881056 RepID=UPI0008AF598D|nr:isochorismate pyruvate lyase [Loktanella sp. DSM 29012]